MFGGGVENQDANNARNSGLNRFFVTLFPGFAVNSLCVSAQCAYSFPLGLFFAAAFSAAGN